MTTLPTIDAAVPAAAHPVDPGRVSTRAPGSLRTDAIIAAVTVLFLALPTLLLGTVGFGWHWLLAAIVALAIPGAILLRRTQPVLAIAGLTVLAVVHVVVAAPMFPMWFGVLVVLYSAGRFSRWPGRLAAFGLALVASVLAAYWMTTTGGIAGFSAGQPVPIEEIVRFVAFLWIPPMLLFSMTILVGWGVAAAARTEAATVVAQVSLQRADQEEERAALARDMHDVVAHSLAVVIAQANGARYTADPAAKDASLETIAGTAKEALGDVRLLLAQLRHSEAPDPVASLDDVDVLVERMRASGLDVRVERAGDRPALPRTADIAAYRILQEALTNALRHGDRAEPVHVRLHGVPVAPGATGIVLDVHNRMLSAPGHPGHGVRGMHERARLAGGDAWTGVEGGWFRVRAAFPAGLMQQAGAARSHGSAA
ncbi:sensor histidine kinase [Agrococcus sp. DT81.2]|uniref:sensor histidine kinase n=1 Tax=Agrococcus sp. DT81.2 TaxID=3393414 RepID=UPI003CE49D1B